MNETTTQGTSTTSPTPTPTTRWRLDPSHSAVGFSVRHLMITNVRGDFARFRGDVLYDAARPEATRIDATIDIASLDTHEPKRDEDLKSELFFDVARHPEMTFVSREARRIGEDGLDVIGDLTIRGVTREATLAVRDLAGPLEDMRGNRRMGATATTKVRRAEFGMTWNKTLDAGGVVVGDVVVVSLEISLVAAG
jgi:polyisoprenoid-binding protein YceI